MVKSVERALNILEELGRIKDESVGIGVLKLGRILKLKSSTVHNLLKTLVYRKYVEKIAETRKYRLGSSCRYLVREKLITSRLTRAAEVPIFNLSHKIDESIALAIYHRGERFVISQTESSRPLRVDMSPSPTPGIYETATGRVLLSRLADKELKGCVKRHKFPGPQWNGISNFLSLRRELARVRQEGMAVRKDREKQICALAVPVDEEKGKLIASLGLYLPSVRFKGKHKKEVIKGLKEAAREISIRFNY